MAVRSEEALQSLCRAHFQGLPLCLDSLTSLLQPVFALKDLALARTAHAVIISNDLQSLPLLGDHLVRLFGIHGTLIEACLAFSQNAAPSAYTWQAIMSSHVAHGKYEATLELYHDMQSDGIMPNKFIYPCVLQACGGAHLLEQGLYLHEHIQKSALESTPIVANTLIVMYTKCGSLKDAAKVFEGMKHKDVITWGSIISGYCQYGESLTALNLFSKMQLEGIAPNRVVFLCVLKACANIFALEEGRLMHEQIIRLHFEVDILLGNTLIYMYAKCGSLKDAETVLQGLAVRIVSSWNAMIGGYALYGAVDPAFELFRSMQIDGTCPDTVTYTCVLTLCGNESALQHGMSLHEHIVSTGLDSNEFVGNSLVDMYSKCGNLDEAHNVFNSLPKQNYVSWGALFAGYAQHAHGMCAFELFQKMLQKGLEPNEVVLSCILKACTSFEGPYLGKVTHSYVIIMRFESDPIVGNILVDMYSKFGCLEDAIKVFNQLVSPNVVSWGAILAGFAQHDQGKAAVDWLRKMLLKDVKPDATAYCCVVKACGNSGLLEEGRWIHDQLYRNGLQFDVAIGNALIEMYVKCDSLEDAHNLFETMRVHDVVTWNLLMAAYSHSGQALAVIELFERMQSSGAHANQVTFLILLHVFGCMGALEQLKELHSQIYESGLGSDLVIMNSLIDTYGKCGSLADCSRIFDRMSSRDEVSWGSIIAGYTQHGKYRLALESFEAMKQAGAKPNSMIFTSVLSACSRAALTEEGRRHFRSMKDSGIIPTVEHFNCMISLLGRTGFLIEAKELLGSMPVSPDALGWTSLLNSCKAYAETDIGTDCLEHFVSARTLNMENDLMCNVSEQTAKDDLQLEAHCEPQTWKDLGAY
ncbi:hypothetical protein KP509_38G032700 [Ceratopteris richardii]|uniref:Pentatricopeptide repeat-containing protein n=1 Tax=Ceratopteris richardii TaxID=49495 RepID=A0A8T2Q3S6_CERRI|nr:hypothetical protein KP509_38G032700 [Ceratopteris richardii]